MALEFVEGFEADVTIMAALGIILVSSPPIVTAQKHQTISGAGGQRSLNFEDAADTMRIPVKGAPGTKDIGFAYRFASGDGITVDFDIALSTNCRVRLDTDGFVRIYRGAGTTLLATSAGTLSANTWYWIKIAVVAREAASSGRVQVFLNGSTSAFADTGAGVDCRAQTTDDFDTVFFDMILSGDVWLDDYHQFSLGTMPNKQLYAFLKRPTAEHGTPDGTPSTGTDNSATVDEDPVSTADYNELVAAGADDRFVMSALGFSPLEVVGVQTVVYGTAEGSITSARGIAESGASTASGTNQALSTGGAYSAVADVFLVNPNGSVAWTGATVDAAFFGYEVN